jgi:hypothetical protein
VTNTYQDDAPVMEKILEELRLIRCCFERYILTHGDYGDYQMEKFGGRKETYITKTTSGACLNNEHAECSLESCRCFCHERIS